MAMETADHGHYKLEPEVLDESMTRADLAFVLQHLRFGRGGFSSVKLDVEVRNFLLSALQRPHREPT
jgi:hypothetical protein